MATFSELLSGKTLTGLIQGVKTGLPARVPEGFLRPGRNVLKDHTSYLRVDGTRQLARLVQYGGPSRARQQQGVSEVSVKLLHSFEHMDLSVLDLQDLRTLDGQADELGRQEVIRQARHFRALFDNLRQTSVQAALLTGGLKFDAEGNLLDPATASPFFSLDFGVPDGNKAQLNWDGNGDIISADWDEAATSIMTQIRTLKQAALQLTGYPLAHAFYGSAIPGYIGTNTEASAYLKANNDLGKAVFESGEIPQGFAGLQWHPVGDLYFNTPDGSAQPLVAQDTVVFAPEPSVDWYELIQGSYLVPNGMGRPGSAEESLGELERVFGQFSYASVLEDPVAVRVFAGDTWLPLVKVPKAVFIADVKKT